MDKKCIYLVKENKRIDKQFEYFRSFLSLYYFITINKIEDKEIKPLYKEIYNNHKYYDFFYDNFIKEQNILIFTLYNNIPLEFLQYPDWKFYINYYPVMTFYMREKHIFRSTKIELNKTFLPKSLVHINKVFSYYKDNQDYPSKEVIKNFSNKLQDKPSKFNKYDYMNTMLSLEYLKNISPKYFNKKTVFIYSQSKSTDNFIISENCKISSNKLILSSYFIKKNNKKYKFIDDKIVILFDELIYLSILDKITKKKLINCFSIEKLKKGMALYNTINSKKNTIPSNPAYYILNVNERPLEPLNLTKNKYDIYKFKIKKSVNFLNLTNTIFYDNIIVTDKKINCINSKNLLEQSKYCDIDMIYKFKNYDIEPNYNKRLMINLILWKNLKFIDKNTNLHYLMEEFNISGYINNFSYIVYKNNNIKKLSTEIVFVDYENVKNYIMFEKKIN